MTWPADERLPGDGAVFLPLSEVTTSEGLAVALTRALHLPDASRDPLHAVRRHLATRQTLLVLDNFEQLMDAVGVVEDLLRTGAETVALVTSRFVLQLDGEQEWPVPPLELPNLGRNAVDPEEAPAVALFLARARSSLPGLTLGDEDLAYVAEICRRLDGLPLAIELAAARIKLFSPRELWERLARTLDLLSSPSRSRRGPQRHRTLDAALDWSYRLLDDEERRLLRSLAVFAGSFPRSAVARVCESRDGEVEIGEVESRLESLIDRSLVVRMPRDDGPGNVHDAGQSEVRFRLLETTRAFALRQSRRADDEDEKRRKHARWVLDLALRAESELKTGGQAAWLHRLDLEHDQLLAALSWTSQPDVDPADIELGVRLATALARYWTMRSYGEGREALERALRAADASEVSPQVSAQARLALGMLCLLLGDYNSAQQSLHLAADSFRATRDESRLAEALDHLSWIAANRTDLERADQMATEALRLHQKHGQHRGVSVALNNLAWCRFFARDLQAADEFFARSLEARRRAEDGRGEGYALINRAIATLYSAEEPDLQEVSSWLREAEGKVGQLEDKPLRAWLDSAWAFLDLRQGDAERSITRLEDGLESEGIRYNLEGTMWLRLMLSHALAQAGQTAASRDMARRAMESADEIGCRWAVAEGRSLRGEPG